MSDQLERLVKEWRDAQKAIDQLTPQQRGKDSKPLDRLIEAHNALIKFADETLG